MLRRMVDHFLERMARAPEMGALVRATGETSNNIVVTGVRGGGVPALLALLAGRTARPLLVVTSSIERAETLTDGLAFFGAQPCFSPTSRPCTSRTTERSSTSLPVSTRFWRADGPKRKSPDEGRRRSRPAA
jgi:hypothetical protein